MALSPGTRVGPYEILEPIGAGGMGEVYRARDERLSREVAVKVLPPAVARDPERLRRFEQEARATGQLNHPNILAVYDTGTHEGIPFVVEELLEGETLRARLDGGALHMRKAIDLARQVARGLAAAHHKGIVHRDLKPENLFVTSEGRIKILDFGLAKLTQPDAPGGGSALTEAPTQAETGAGVILGTVGYMSPEQVRGHQIDHRSDIFSLGAILYEMLTGSRAFRGESSVETLNAILKTEPAGLSREALQIPQGLERTVQRCLEKNPEERFQSASDLAFQLEALLSASGSVVEPPQAVAAARRPALPSRFLLVSVPVVAALAAGFVAGRWTAPSVPSPTYRQLTFRQGSIFSARFTPDGQTAVYAASWDGAPTELFSTRFGSPGSRSLGLQEAEILAVSPSGEMAVLLRPAFTLGFMRTGTVARVPLAGGQPREVLENVQDADWDPDGKALAIARPVAGRYRLEYPTGNVLFRTGGWISSPRFSRDGRRIGFIHHPGPGDNRGQIAVVDLAGNSQQLTEPFSSAEGLEWSPSENEIWFTAGKTGNVRSLYAVDLSGEQRMVDGAPSDLTLQDISPDGTILLVRNTARRGIMGLAPGEAAERELSYLDWSRPSDLSADGRWLLFEEQGQGGGADYAVYLRGTTGSAPVRLGEGFSCSLSPDGKWALTASVNQPRKVVMLPRGPGEPRTLSIPDLSVNYVKWFPDGKRVLLEAAEPEAAARLWELDLDGGDPRPITPEGIQFPYAISDDGQSIMASGPDDVPRIHAVAGGEPLAIPGAQPGDVPLAFAEGGRAVFVSPRGTLPRRIDRIELGGGDRQPWTALMPADEAGLIDIGFIHLSADARSYVYSYRRVLSTLYLIEGLS